MRLLLPLLTLSGCATVCLEPAAVRGRWDVMATVLSHEGGTHLRAGADNELRGYGLRVQLAAGEEIVFGGLDLPRE